jgi:hypothetical protein
VGKNKNKNKNKRPVGAEVLQLREEVKRLRDIANDLRRELRRFHLEETAKGPVTPVPLTHLGLVTAVAELMSYDGSEDARLDRLINDRSGKRRVECLR